MCVLVLHSCPTLCDPKDCSPPGPSVHGILQARKLEWVAISFSKVCLVASGYQKDKVFKRSVQFSRSLVSDSLQPHESQHARPPCPSPTPRVHPNPCPLSQWCHPTISSSVVPFSSCHQSFPASGSFPVSQFFTSGGQSIAVSASTSILPRTLKDWSPLGLTSLIWLNSKRFSRVFSNTTVQTHQFLSVQLSL